MLLSTVSCFFKISALHSYCKELQHIDINLGNQSCQNVATDQLILIVFAGACIGSLFLIKYAQTFSTIICSISVVTEHELMFSVYNDKLFCRSLQPFYFWCRSDVELSYLFIVTDALLPYLFLMYEFILYGKMKK
jgi:hypothetical protein